MWLVGIFKKLTMLRVSNDAQVFKPVALLNRAVLSSANTSEIADAGKATYVAPMPFGRVNSDGY